MRSAVWLGALLSITLGLVACGGGDGGSVRDVPERLREAYCRRLVRCGSFTTMEECVARVGEPVFYDGDELQHAVEAGRLDYDDAAMSRCVDAIASASCDATAESVRVTPAACDAALKGAVADGGTCYDSHECLSERCNIPICGQACCAGTCAPTVARPALGEPCTGIPRCVDGAFCNRSGVCESLRPAGAPCDTFEVCDYGLACPAPVGQQCVASANRGEPCQSDGGCSDDGDYCDPATSTCIARRGEGEPCQQYRDCQYPLECTGAVGTCSPPPAPGEPCDIVCAMGAFCNDQHRCEVNHVDGATCAEPRECDSLYCDSTGHCAAAPVCG